MARLNVNDLFGSSSGSSAEAERGPGLFGRPRPGPAPQHSPYSGIFGRPREPERGYYISGDRLADFLGEFDKALEKEETDPQFLRAWAALVDFEGAQRTEMRGALDWITPEFRFWSTLGLAGLYVLMRQLKRVQGKPPARPRAHPRTRAQPQPQPPGPGTGPGPGTPQTGPSEAQVREAARSQKPTCEICNVELIALDASTAVCPSCNHEYRRG